MRMILLIAFVMVAGCGKPQTPVADEQPKPEANDSSGVLLIDGTTIVETETTWPIVFRKGHLLVSVYPPVASKVKLEVENTKGEWSPMDQTDQMAVFPYRVVNASHAQAFAIEDSVKVVLSIVDWRDSTRQVRSIDNHDPKITRGRPVRVIAPADGYLDGIVQNRPYSLPPGKAVAGAAVFHLGDLADFDEAVGGGENVGIACSVESDSTGDVASAVIVLSRIEGKK